MTTSDRIQAAAAAMTNAMPDDDAETLASAIGVVTASLALASTEPVDVLAVVNRVAGALISGELPT